MRSGTSVTICLNSILSSQYSWVDMRQVSLITLIERTIGKFRYYMADSGCYAESFDLIPYGMYMETFCL
jgi:hypothetical protein